MKTPRIVVIGSLNTDMVIHGARIPEPGETVLGGRFLMNQGGKGANQAVAAARLGADVSFVGMVGRDVFGDEAIASLEREGIDARHVYQEGGESTGVALIVVDEAGENRISVASGANLALSPREVLLAEPMIREADLVMLQLEVPLDTVIFAARLARKHGVPVLLNPAPATALTSALLECVDWITPNENEAERLSGLSVHGESGALAAARKLLFQGARHVIITRGAQGVLIVDHRREETIPAVSVKVMDTTAAGDAFNAGLAYALARGESLRKAAHFGCRVAALAVQRAGAQASLPYAHEVESFMAVG